MYRVSDHVRSTHGPDGGTLLDIRKGLIFALDPVASRIVELLKAGSSQMEISNKLESQFKGGREIIEADVKAFLDQLRLNGIIDDP